LGRKNPDAVLRAWAAVADDFPHHSLILKTMALAEEGTEELAELIRHSPRTTVIDDHLSDEEYHELVAQASAYITLPRSEGLGLTPLEAAVHAVPVVYSDYSGLRDNFQSSFFPVPVTMVRVGDSGYDNTPYPDDAWWGEPDASVAAEQLRRALAMNHDEARVQGDAIIERLRRDQDRALATVHALSDVDLSDHWRQIRPRLGQRPWHFKLARRARRLLAPVRPLIAAPYRFLPEALRRRLRPTRR
jgi:glycosyltransferase involved in cell wall biosynthesis